MSTSVNQIESLIELFRSICEFGKWSITGELDIHTCTSISRNSRMVGKSEVIPLTVAWCCAEVPAKASTQECAIHVT